MISRLFLLTVLTLVVVTITRAVANASQAVYFQAQQTMTAPYAKAQLLYDEAHN